MAAVARRLSGPITSRTLKGVGRGGTDMYDSYRTSSEFPQHQLLVELKGNHQTCRGKLSLHFRFCFTYLYSVEYLP